MRRHYGKKTVAEMAKHLGRSYAAIQGKADRLQLTNTRMVEEEAELPEMGRHGLRPGDKIRLTLPGLPGFKKTAGANSTSRASKRQYTGRVLQVHQGYILVKLPKWRECVNIGTIIAGEAHIELLERRGVA